MQLLITLSNPNRVAFPLACNHQIQSAIYGAIRRDAELAEFIHERGFGGGEDIFKLFTFGNLNGACRIEGKSIRFFSDIELEIRSVSRELCAALNNALLPGENLRLFSTALSIKKTELAVRHIECDSAVVKTASPIVAKRKCGEKTVYYSPEQNEFAELININFIKKYAVFYGEPPKQRIVISPRGASKKVVTEYKKYYITAYAGEFELSGNAESLDFLYNTGLGSKNSQGFGMFDIVT